MKGAAPPAAAAPTPPPRSAEAQPRADEAQAIVILPTK